MELYKQIFLQQYLHNYSDAFFIQFKIRIHTRFVDIHNSVNNISIIINKCTKK